MEQFLFSPLRLINHTVFSYQWPSSYLELKFLSQELSVPIPSVALSNVMKYHGYDIHGQVGLLTLLDIHSIDIPKQFSGLEAANLWLRKSTQKLLRRGERWSEKNKIITSKLIRERNRLKKAVQLLGMLSEMKPDSQEIRNFVGVLPGALEPRVKKRIAVVHRSILEENFSLHKLVIATGYRRLHQNECPILKSEEEQLESNMIELVWKSISKNNSQLSSLPVKISIAEAVTDQMRSTTVDTARALGELAELKDQNILMYIEQPYAARFYSIFNSEVKKNNNHLFLYVTCSRFERMEYFIFQDEVARRIYYQYPFVKARIMEKLFF